MNADRRKRQNGKEAGYEKQRMDADIIRLEAAGCRKCECHAKKGAKIPTCRDEYDDSGETGAM